MSKNSNLPDNAEACFLQGSAKGGQGDYCGAIADFDRAIELKDR